MSIPDEAPIPSVRIACSIVLAMCGVVSFLKVMATSFLSKDAAADKFTGFLPMYVYGFELRIIVK